MTKGIAKIEDCVIFATALGWMGVIASGKTVRRLGFGFRSRRAVADALGRPGKADQSVDPWLRGVASRLQDYAAGKRVVLSDIAVDLAHLTDFQRRVMLACRSIPYGGTMSYGQLAAEAGSPGAARAVGNCMAANLVPLIVPCHRVVRSQGDVGQFSSPGGARMKLRLLRLETGRQDGLAAGRELD